MLKLAKAGTREASSTVTMIGSPHYRERYRGKDGEIVQNIDLPATYEDLGDVALVGGVETDRGLVRLHLTNRGPGLEPVALLQQPFADGATSPGLALS